MNKEDPLLVVNAGQYDRVEVTDRQFGNAQSTMLSNMAAFQGYFMQKSHAVLQEGSGMIQTRPKGMSGSMHIFKTLIDWNEYSDVPDDVNMRFIARNEKMHFTDYVEKIRGEIEAVPVPETSVRIYIAADGPVDDVSQMVEVAPNVTVIDINHHHINDALGTRCSAKQFFDLLISGKIIRPDRAHRTHEFKVTLDDSDQDVSLVMWMMKNARKILSNESFRKKVEMLLMIEDPMDVNAGLCSINLEDPQLRELVEKVNAIYMPYNNVRPLIPKIKDSAELAAVHEKTVNQCMQNMDAYAAGTLEGIPVNTHYDTLAKDPDGKWIIVKENAETGQNYRIKLTNEGYRLIIVARQVNESDDSWAYGLFKTVPDEVPDDRTAYDVDLPTLYGFLNFEESRLMQQQNAANDVAANNASSNGHLKQVNTWNGRTNAGGSYAGSTLIKPENMKQIADSFVFPTR